MKISVTYYAKWQIKDKPYYVWTECKKLINTKTSTEIIKTIKGSQPGYYIDRKFISFEDLKKHIEIIKPKQFCPFSTNYLVLY